MQKVTRSRLTRGVCRIFGVLWLALLMFGVTGFAASPVDWTVGDVFVSIGNGNYQVWHFDTSSQTWGVVQSFNDQIGANQGQGSGCAFDSGYRLFTTNFANSSVVRFAIDNLDDVTPIALASSLQTKSNIAQTIAGGFVNSESIAFNGSGNFFVGYAGGVGAVEIYDHDGNRSNYFSPSIDQKGVDWLDIASDGTTIFYTSEGRKIFMLNTAGVNPGDTPTSAVYADLSTLGGNISSGKLFAIRILPPGDGTGGVLVADQANVKLVKSSCSGGTCTVQSVQIFKFKNESNLQSLSLDPSSPSTKFWVGDASSKDFMRYNIATGNTEVTLNTTAVLAGVPTGPPGGLCVDGGFSAAQLAFSPPPTSPPALPATQSFKFDSTNSNSTHVFTSPFTATALTATLTGIANNDTVPVTVRFSLVDPSVAKSDPVVYSFNLGGLLYSATPQSPADCSQFPGCTVNGGIDCDKRPTPGGDKCEIFEFEANPNTKYSAANLQLNVPLPPNTDIPNVRFLRNFDEDVTTGIVDYPLSGTKSKCVFSVNTQTSNPATQVCAPGFSSPIAGASFTKKLTSSITFKFKATNNGSCPPTNSSTPPACTSGTQGTKGCLTPLLLIAQTCVGSNCSPTQAPVPINVIVAGNSGGPPTFVLSGNTYQLQVKTTDMQIGSYLATVVDLNTQIPSFSVPFTLQ